MFCKFQAVCNSLSVSCCSIHFVVGKNRVHKISPAQELLINGETWIHTQAAGASVPTTRLLIFCPAIHGHFVTTHFFVTRVTKIMVEPPALKRSGSNH